MELPIYCAFTPRLEISSGRDPCPSPIVLLQLVVEIKLAIRERNAMEERNALAANAIRDIFPSLFTVSTVFKTHVEITCVMPTKLVILELTVIPCVNVTLDSNPVLPPRLIARLKALSDVVIGLRTVESNAMVDSNAPEIVFVTRGTRNLLTRSRMDAKWVPPLFVETKRGRQESSAMVVRFVPLVGVKPVTPLSLLPTMDASWFQRAGMESETQERSAIPTRDAQLVNVTPVSNPRVVLALFVKKLTRPIAETRSAIQPRSVMVAASAGDANATLDSYRSMLLRPLARRSLFRLAEI